MLYNLCSFLRFWIILWVGISGLMRNQGRFHEIFYIYWAMLETLLSRSDLRENEDALDMILYISTELLHT